MNQKINQMFKNKKTQRYLIIALAIIAILVPIIKRKIAISREKPPENYPVTLEVIIPKKGSLRTQETFLGLFKPENQAAISSRLTARVTFIAEEGTLVKKGDVILKLDTSDIQANVEALSIKKENQKKVYERDKVLFEHQAISQEQFENSQNLYYQAVSAYEAAVAQLSYGVVTAPFDAVVGKRFINTGDTAYPGKVLLQLDGNGPNYEVYADLPVETTIKIKPGSQHEIFFNGQTQNARVKAVVPSNNNNLMTVKLSVSGNPLNIPAGTYVDIHFYTSNNYGWIIPANSVQHNTTGYFALTIKENTAHFVPVKILGFDGVNYCVEDLPGDIKIGVAASPQEILKIYEGQKVNVAKEL